MVLCLKFFPYIYAMRKGLTILMILYASCVFGQETQKMQEPASEFTFNVDIGLPVSTANEPYREIMDGLLGVSVSGQYHFDFPFYIGVGGRYSLFTVNEFAITEPINGAIHSYGGFLEIGYNKFINEYFAIDFGIKTGYLQHYSKTKKTNGALEVVANYANKTSSLLISPELHLILKADENDAYSFVLGYNIYGYGFNPSFIGLSTNSDWDISKYHHPTQFLLIGFGYVHYFK